MTATVLEHHHGQPLANPIRVRTVSEQNAVMATADGVQGVSYLEMDVDLQSAIVRFRLEREAVRDASLKAVITSGSCCNTAKARCLIFEWENTYDIHLRPA